jgi:hypothetical protein
VFFASGNLRYAAKAYSAAYTLGGRASQTSVTYVALLFYKRLTKIFSNIDLKYSDFCDLFP